MNLPAALLPFLQPELPPAGRHAGLHSVLDARFPVDGRLAGTGPLLDYLWYELVDAAGDLSLDVTLRLSWWADGAIEDVFEQPIGFLIIVPDHGRPYPSLLVALDRSAEDVVEHVTSIIDNRASHARAKIGDASRDTTPADLVIA